MCSYISGFLEVLIEYIFFIRCMGKKDATKQMLLFIILGTVFSNLQISILRKFLLIISLLLAYSTLVLKTNIKLAILYAILTIVIMQLCYGTFNSISVILSSFLYGFNPELFSQIFMIVGNLLALGLASLNYWIIFKYMKKKEGTQSQYVLLI